MPTTSTGIAYDRAGDRGSTPLLLIHAGIADRRMWDPVWAPLTAARDVVRLDLRGYGSSVSRPVGSLDPVADVLAVLDDAGIARADVVGASFGAGVAVELASARPAALASLLLVGPGGSLLAERTEDFAAFAAAENAAIEAGDLAAAAAASVRWWVVGPGRDDDEVDPTVRDAVHRMQQLAFALTAEWDDLFDAEPATDPLDRLDEIAVPTTVLVGAYDLHTVRLAAAAVVAGVRGAVRVDWDDVAHLPSMEQPERFVELVLARPAATPGV